MMAELSNKVAPYKGFQLCRRYPLEITAGGLVIDLCCYFVGIYENHIFAL